MHLCYPVSIMNGQTRIYALISEKGGVGKTTSAVNLGHALARLEQRVLAVDLDPQASLTHWIGTDTPPSQNMADVLRTPVSIEAAIGPSRAKGVDLLYGTNDTAVAGIQVQISHANPAMSLSRAIQRIVDRYDTILLDCPPSLGLLYSSALIAATHILIPVNSQAAAVHGASQVYVAIVDLQNQGAITRSPHVDTLLTCYSSGLRLARAVRDEMHNTGTLLDTTIRTSTQIAEAYGARQSIYDYAPAAPVAGDYERLARELLEGAPSHV